MAQLEIETILARQLASYLTMPVFVVDADGTLLYFNESAEPILGLRFDETGEMSPQEWGSIFIPTDEAGSPLPLEELPLYQCMVGRRPTHRVIWITGLDGGHRNITVTCIPLNGQRDRFLGAIAFFVEVLSEARP